MNLLALDVAVELPGQYVVIFHLEVQNTLAPRVRQHGTSPPGRGPGPSQMCETEAVKLSQIVLPSKQRKLQVDECSSLPRLAWGENGEGIARD